MTTVTQAVTSAPGLLLVAVIGVAVAGPAGLLAALAQRGWTPGRLLRERRRRR